MEVKTNPFYELRDRLYASAAAGCSLISEDFRLLRATEAFKPMAETNKVFAKLYNMCSSLISSAQPAADIADCIALADALAVTQGTFADNSETSPAEPNSGIIPAKIPYIKLAEYKDRIRRCRNSYPTLDEEFCDSVHDPRLLSLFMEIADSQGSAAYDMIEAFIDGYGENLIKPLLDSIDFSNPKANGHQIELISKIAGAEQNDLYISLAENEENPQGVRIAAVKAMSCTMENEELLFRLYRTGKGRIKTAALRSLAFLGSEKADEPLKKYFGKTNESDFEMIAASSGTVCLEYIDRRIDSFIESGASMIWQIRMLANKKDAFDCFMKIADNSAKNVAEEYTAPHIIDVNQVLVNNLYYHNEPEYKELIIKLYEARPDFFFTSRFFLELLEHPESACTTMNDGRSFNISDMLSLIGCISYSHMKNYKIEFYVHRTYSDVKRDQLFRTLFTSIPDDIISFLTDTTGLHKGISFDECDDNYQKLLTNSLARAGVLRRFLEKCSPADKERLSIAASDYAWKLFDSEAKFSALSLLLACSEKPLKGIIKSCVFSVLKYGEKIAASYYTEKSVLSEHFFRTLNGHEELLISELQELVTELPDFKEAAKELIWRQLDVIYKVLGKHGIVYEGEKQ